MAIVFRGEPASAHVVAGYLRSAGMREVEVIGEVRPYPAGPLRQAFIRVEDEERARELLGQTQPGPPIAWREYPMWMRVVAIYLVMWRFIAG